MMLASPTKDTHSQRTLGFAGLIACLLFCGIGVAARGIRWDETYEHAQVLAGTVIYPAVHPLPVYLAKAFSLQTLLSALLTSAGGGAAVVCGLRNFLFLCASVLPAYAMTLLATQRASMALAAAMLTMQGALLAFDGSYPLMVWPELYSNGHIGTGAAVLTLAAFAAPWPRTAMFLLGVLPGLHVGQAPLLWLVAGLFLVLRWSTPEGRALWRALPWGVLGLGLTVLGYLVYRGYFASDAPMPPGLGDRGAILRAFTTHLDIHRQPPGGNLWWLMLATVAVAGVHWRRSTGALRWTWSILTGYAAAVVVLIGVTALAQRVYGTALPVWVLQWMPYRLGNHLPPVLLAGSLGLLLPRDAARAPGIWLAALVVAVGIVTPYLGGVMPETVYARYVAQGEGVLFVLVGAALGYALLTKPSGGWWWPAAGLLLAVVLTGCIHQFGAACLALGIVLGWGSRYMPKPLPAVALAGISLLAAGQMLWNQARVHENLPRTPLDTGIATTVASWPVTERAILAPPENYALQMRTGAPVLMDAATLSLISYVPAIGPRINSLCWDLYGFRLDAPSFDMGRWRAIWPARTAREWQMLAEIYGFHGVLAPADVPLHLPERVRTASGVFYSVE